MKRDQLRKLLAGTGVDVPKPRGLFERVEFVWAGLFLIHAVILLGLADLTRRLLND